MAARESRTLVTVAAVGAIVALVGGIYAAVAVRARRDAAASAGGAVMAPAPSPQAAVLAWEARWHEAVTCLLGDRRLADDATVALTAAELRRMHAGAGDELGCEVVVDLARADAPPGDTSPAWQALAASTRQLIDDNRGVLDFERSDEPLFGRWPDHRGRHLGAVGETIAAVERDATALRAAVGLPSAAVASVAALPEITPGPALETPREWHWTAEVRDARVILIGHDDRMVVLSGPTAAPRWLGRTATGVVALPDGAWAVDTSPDRTGRIGAIAGAPGRRTALPVDANELSWSGPTELVAALGTGAERTILLAHRQTGLPVAVRSRDAGLTWTRLLPFDRGTSLEVHSDGVMIIPGGMSGAARWADATSGTIGDELSWLRSVCSDDGAVWRAAGAAPYLVREDDGAEQAIDLRDRVRVLGCTRDAALIIDDRNGDVGRCTADACTWWPDSRVHLSYREARARGLGVISADGAALVTQLGRVVAVWTPGTPVRMFELAGTGEVIAAVVWDDRLHLIVVDDAVHVAEVPAAPARATRAVTADADDAGRPAPPPSAAVAATTGPPLANVDVDAIRAWQASWRFASVCLFGATRDAAEPGVALAIGELRDRPEHCHGFPDLLGPPPELATRRADLLVARIDLDRAVFAVRDSHGGEFDPNARRAAQARAITALDAAAAPLLAAAGIAADPAPPALPAVTVGAERPDGSDPVASRPDRAVTSCASGGATWSITAAGVLARRDGATTAVITTLQATAMVHLGPCTRGVTLVETDALYRCDVAGCARFAPHGAFGAITAGGDAIAARQAGPVVELRHGARPPRLVAVPPGATLLGVTAGPDGVYLRLDTAAGLAVAAVP